VTYTDRMRTLFIDADACPVTREAISIARSHGLKVLLVANGTQNLSRHMSRAGVEAVQVSGGRDAADFAIIERLNPDDIVVTQDIGLAAMVLGRSAHAIGPRGRVYSHATIDLELEFRHAEQKHRRAGGRTGGPSKFEDDDRQRFEDNLRRILGE
jgi:uncharacterized protein YaiI (UPF0178 family)